MKKRLLSIILTLCMVMSITPLNAFAVTEYGIWIGEEQVTSDKTWSKQGVQEKSCVFCSNHI
jgi:hypothetical protein